MKGKEDTSTAMIKTSKRTMSIIVQGTRLAFSVCHVGYILNCITTIVLFNPKREKKEKAYRRMFYVPLPFVLGFAFMFENYKNVHARNNFRNSWLWSLS